VWRFERNGVIDHDVIALDDEDVQGAKPILERVMANGRRLAESPPLDEVRNRCASTLAALPNELKSLTHSAEYQVERSERLRDLVDRTSAAGR
jgi:nicotinate phosphoribosyltransferase